MMETELSRVVLFRSHSMTEESQQKHLHQVMQHFQVVQPSPGITPRIEALHIGLINDTWYVSYLPDTERQYVLQRVNHKVFKSPADIDANIRLLAAFVHEYYPSTTFLSCIPLHTCDACVLCVQERQQEGSMSEEDTLSYYRLFAYIPQSYTLTTVDNTLVAFEAAKGFGQFCSIFHNQNVSDDSRRQMIMEQLKVTLADFHNLTLRQEQFQLARDHCNLPTRLQKCTHLIDHLQGCLDIPETYVEIAQSAKAVLQSRVTHHDCKISNILLSTTTHEALVVIDLDTTMPGYFISDLGDLYRTILPPGGEEETDLSQVYVRMEYFTNVTRGYLSAMFSVLTAEELAYVVYAGEFILYMQAIRYLTDYLNGDVYYKVKHSEHNFQRAENQCKLLLHYRSLKAELQLVVDGLVQEFSTSNTSR